jgi:hypothetical protein
LNKYEFTYLAAGRKRKRTVSASTLVEAERILERLGYILVSVTKRY